MLEATETGKFACNVPVTGNHACERTEPRFLQAVAQLAGTMAPDDPFCPKPILVTHEGEVCGLLKFVGDNTFLGLRDVREAHILQEGIYGFSSKLTIDCLRSAAREIPQSTIVEFSDIIDIVGAPDALRPSYFALGPEVFGSFNAVLRKPMPTIDQVRTSADTYMSIYSQRMQRHGSKILTAFHAIHNSRS